MAREAAAGSQDKIKNARATAGGGGAVGFRALLSSIAPRGPSGQACQDAHLHRRQGRAGANLQGSHHIAARLPPATRADPRAPAARPTASPCPRRRGGKPQETNGDAS
jgi:hypothetical protein